MKYTVHLIKLCFVTIVLFFNFYSYAQQSTTLNYQSKGKNISSARIYLSDQNGSESISNEQVIQDPKVYFTVVSADEDSRGYFKEKEFTEYLTSIQLFQDDKIVPFSGLIKPLYNAEEEAEMVLLSVNKSDLLLYKPFEFRSGVDQSDPMNLDDAFCESYHEYHKKNELGKDYLNKEMYLLAFSSFISILEDANDKPELPYYAFWKSASELYIETAIEQYIQSNNTAFNGYVESFYQNHSLNDLEKQDSLLSDLEDAIRIFEPYAVMEFPKSEMYALSFKRILEEKKAIVEKNHVVFNLEKMRFLKMKSYQDSYRFTFFVDLISRMLCELDTLKAFSKLAPIHPEKYPDWNSKKQELSELGWLNQFEAVIEVINVNILEKGVVVKDTVLNNLKQQIPFQHQPYFEILNAFNHYNTNLGKFKENLLQAIRKCTDDNLCFNMEMWVLSSDIQLDSKVVKSINQGIKMIRAGDFDGADTKFRILTQQAPTLAPPWFYWGEVKDKNNEHFVAESMFARAIERYPQYIRPQSFVFQDFVSANDYAGLYEAVEKALLVNDIWLFHYWKAAALYYQKKYMAVIVEIENGCNMINPWSANAYFMLGDAYRELHDTEKARWAYEKANSIDPYTDNDTFNKAMQMLE